MIIVTDSHKLSYELSNVARLFFPAENMNTVEQPSQADTAQAIVSFSDCTTGSLRQLAVTLSMPSRQPRIATAEMAAGEAINLPIELGKLLYKLLAAYTGRTVDWGVLTGIRPVKLARKLRNEGYSPAEIEKHFVSHYLTTPAKAALCCQTDREQKSTIESALPLGYSLYISVPFCPSRCSYCSFVSHSTANSLRMIPDYVDKLCIELEYTAKLAEARGLGLQTIYMGGGTPTILTAQQLEQVLKTVHRCYDLSACSEITVEAGRPDTITADKLEVMKRLGVNRISVNCQTLNDDVLTKVGRKHTAADFYNALKLVKTYSFTAVNVDLIAGLPGDTLASFEKSLKSVIERFPENITVHALTVKRAAGLHESKQTILGDDGGSDSEVGAMVNLSQELLACHGYRPYYLYRQKGTVDSLENVGFARDGHACRYNIFIMDETHTILSVGGGGVTKLVRIGENAVDEEMFTIKRIFNYKYPYEYLERFDTMLAKKQAILDFSF